MNQSRWHKKFLDMTELISTWSKDRSTKVGAVIVDDNKNVLSVGYNGFPRKVNDNIDSRHERPIKYMFTEHAERNAIFSAARNGIRLEGSTIYLLCKWPCPDCTRGIIQSGIKRLVTYDRDFPGMKNTWEESFKVTMELLDEAEIEVIIVNEDNLSVEIWKKK